MVKYKMVDCAFNQSINESRFFKLD